MSADKRADSIDAKFPRAPAANPRGWRLIFEMRVAVPVFAGVVAILTVAQAFVGHDRAPIRTGKVPRAHETLVIPHHATRRAPTGEFPPRIVSTGIALRATTPSAPGLPPGTTRIIAPDRSVSWAIGRDGAIFRINRAGAVSSQSSEVTTNLTAGAAVSARVCWVVGKAGTILRTTDGGAHWSQLSAPVGDDKRAIIAVSARSANDASVIDAAGQRNYTTDGGGAWSRR